MNSSFTKQALTAPITLLRPSTEEERRLFKGQEKGWFYTFCLQSDQSFVAYIHKWGDTFIFRPLNNLVPKLAQVQWVNQRTFGGPSFDVICQTTSDASKEEKMFLTEVFSPHRKRYDLGCFMTHKYQYPLMLDKAWQLQKQLLENEKLKLELLNGRRTLQKLMIQNNKKTTITQLKLNERRQNG